MDALEKNIELLLEAEPHIKYKNLPIDGKENITLWYDFDTGEIKGIGENYLNKDSVCKRFEVENSGILPFIVPFPERCPKDEEKGLFILLESIMNYRTTKYKKKS